MIQGWWPFQFRARPGARSMLAGDIQASFAPGQTVYSNFVRSGSVNEMQVRVPLQFACVVRRLKFWTTSPQPAGGALVVTVMRNGAPTGITYSLAANAMPGLYSSDDTGEVFAADDGISLYWANNDMGAATAYVAGFSLMVEAIE